MLMSKTRPYYCERTPAVMAGAPTPMHFHPPESQGLPGGRKAPELSVIGANRETDQREEEFLAEMLP